MPIPKILLEGPTPSYVAWRGGERERGHASSFDQNPNVGCQELAPQLPALYEMGCSLYLPKEADNMPIISDFIEKKIKKIEYSYEIRMYFFKIIGFFF